MRWFKKLYGINVDIDSQINYLFNISRVAIKGDKIYLKEDYDDEGILLII